jgi:hypothetical protein
MAHGPNDAATQWLLDQMHNPNVSLRHRMECAKILLEIHRKRCSGPTLH